MIKIAIIILLLTKFMVIAKGIPLRNNVEGLAANIVGAMILLFIFDTLILIMLMEQISNV